MKFNLGDILKHGTAKYRVIDINAIHYYIRNIKDERIESSMSISKSFAENNMTLVITKKVDFNEVM